MTSQLTQSLSTLSISPPEIDDGDTLTSARILRALLMQLQGHQLAVRDFYNSKCDRILQEIRTVAEQVVNAHAVYLSLSKWGDVSAVDAAVSEQPFDISAVMALQLRVIEYLENRLGHAKDQLHDIQQEVAQIALASSSGTDSATSEEDSRRQGLRLRTLTARPTVLAKATCVLENIENCALEACLTFSEEQLPDDQFEPFFEELAAGPLRQQQAICHFLASSA
ncbi:hypothetical protein BDZ91DRAFT_768574 [Kalaharituber pfeilii]|nr:hypothetical protein BDZ91DRAFT_768574 [Kalaharituber pfeilii]